MEVWGDEENSSSLDEEEMDSLMLQVYTNKLPDTPDDTDQANSSPSSSHFGLGSSSESAKLKGVDSDVDQGSDSDEISINTEVGEIEEVVDNGSEEDTPKSRGAVSGMGGGWRNDVVMNSGLFRDGIMMNWICQ